MVGCSLLSPVTIGALRLRNRVVMAPMTRNRAQVDGVPSSLATTYYAQRVSAGLVVTEGTYPEPMGQAYPRTPGLCDDRQAAGWRAIVEAVRARGGTIVLQLMHGGRISHPDTLPGGATPLAPSAVRPSGTILTGAGKQPFVAPRAMHEGEIVAAVDGYARAARLAREVGFDGVEIHAAAGYLPAQFLSSNTNLREDAWGGAAAGRARFLLEVVTACGRAIGPGRVGVRVAPTATVNGVRDACPEETYEFLAGALAEQGLAYLHVIRSLEAPFDEIALLRRAFRGPLIANGGFDAVTAAALVDAGRADLVSFARAYIANPDLVERIAGGAAWAAADPATFYTPGPHGYVDYPTWEP